MYLQRKHLPAQWPVSHIKLTLALTVITNAWYIFWHVRPVLRSMLLVPQSVSGIVGTIINVTTKNMREVSLVCKNIFLNILIVNGTLGSDMTFQLHWLIKLMGKILLNENTTGDIPSKRWHLMVWMLKMISKLWFVFTFNWYHVLIFYLLLL